MSSEYYVICPEKKLVLQLYKLNGILQSPRILDDALASYSEIEADQAKEIEDDKEWFMRRMASHEHQLSRLVCFLKVCNGCQLHYFDDNGFLDWWYTTYPREDHVPSFSHCYKGDWKVL